MNKTVMKLLSGLLVSTFVFTNLQVVKTVQASENETNESVANNTNEFKDNPLSKEDLQKLGKYKNLLQSDGDTDNLGIEESLNHGTTSPIVVLIKFKGQTDEEAYSKSEINDIKEAFSGETNSLKNYLETASYGQCSVNPQLTFEQGSNLYIYEAPYTKEYYSPYDEYKNPIGYHDMRDRQKLLIDAFASIKDKLPSDINYDVNKDGYYDGVDFFLPDQTDWSSFLWPHKWELYDTDRVTEKNGCILYNYNVITKEYFSYAKYKVITHEYLHTLGYPDFYLYDDTGSFNDPMGDWSIMSATNGFQSVYERIAYSSWISKDDIETISDEGIYKLDNVAMEPKNHNIAYKIEIPNTNQYFMIEYRNKSANIYTNNNNQGIVTYRIDDSKDGNAYEDPEIYALRDSNNKIQMDNTSDVRTLILSSGEETGYKVQYVEEKDGQASFKLIKYTPKQREIKINSVDISSENGNCNIKVNADNTTGLDLKYTYIKVDEKGKEQALLSNSSNNFYSVYTDCAKIKVVVSDANGGIGTYVSDDIHKKIIKGITIDKGNSIKNLDTVNISIDLNNEADKDKYTYTIYAYLGELDEIILEDENTNNGTWKPKQTGKYTIEAIVKNDDIVVDRVTTEVNVTDSMLINMSKNSPAELGDKITLTAKSSNPEGNYKYRFSVISNGKKEFLSTFTTKNSVVWTPKTEGKYQLVFEMMDSNQVIIKRTMDYDVIITEYISSIDGLDKEFKLGDEIIATVNTKYSGDFTYSMDATYIDEQGNLEELGTVVNDTSKNVLKWTPSGIGTYYLLFHIKSNGIEIDRIQVEVQVNGNIKPQIKTSVSSPQNINTPIIITASSEGTGKYKYRCSIYRNGKVKYISNIVDIPRLKWTPKESGNYVIKVEVMDTNGHIESITKNYKIESAIKITNISVNNDKEVKYFGDNTKINITVNTEGGDGDNRYYVIAQSMYSEEVILSNGDSNTCNYTMNEYMSNIKIKVIVIDKNGNFDNGYKEISISDVSPSLNILPGKAIFLGDTFSLNCKANNNEDNKYRYAVAYGEYLDGDVIYGEEKYISEFNESSTMNWKPDKVGEYKVIVEVKDADGNIYKKYDYVAVKDGKEVYVNKIKIESSNNMAVKSPIKITPDYSSKGKVTKIVYEIYDMNKGILVAKTVSTKDSVVWVPKECGQYTARILVYNEYNNMSIAQEEFYVINTITINSFTSDKEGSQKVGTDIIFSTEASGDGDLYYRYLIYKDGEIVKQTAYLDKSECTFKPKVAGEYVIKVKIKNNLGIMVSKTMKITIV